MRKTNVHSINPALRGAAYYGIFFGVMGVYFAYVNVAFIQRGYSGVQLGVFSSLSAVVILLASPFLTGLADNRGWHRPILALSHLLFALSLVGIHFVQDFTAVLPLMAIAAFASAPFNPLSDGLVIHMANQHQLDFGKMRVWGSIGFTALCVVSGWVYDQIGLSLLFLVGAVLFLGRGASVALLDPVEKHEATHLDMPAGLKGWLSPLKDKIFLVFLIGIFLWGCASTGFFTYASIYMDHLSDSSFLVGLMMALPALVEVPGVLLADRLARRYGLLPLLIFGILTFTAVVFLTCFITDPVLIVILNAARGIGYGIFIIVALRFVDARAPRNRIGTYQSLYGLAFFTIPSLVFMPILGVIYDNYSLQTLFVLDGIVGISAAGLLIWLQQLVKQNENA